MLLSISFQILPVVSLSYLIFSPFIFQYWTQFTFSVRWIRRIIGNKVLLTAEKKILYLQSVYANRHQHFIYSTVIVQELVSAVSISETRSITINSADYDQFSITKENMEHRTGTSIFPQHLLKHQELRQEKVEINIEASMENTESTGKQPENFIKTVFVIDYGCCTTDLN